MIAGRSRRTKKSWNGQSNSVANKGHVSQGNFYIIYILNIAETCIIYFFCFQPFLISLMLMGFQQLSGVNFVNGFVNDIFQVTDN